MLKFIPEVDWVTVVVTVLAAPPVTALAGWVWKRWREPFTPQTQSKQDRRNYYLLLHKYESYLDLLSDLIIRAQVEAGPDDYTPEMKREFVRTRDRIYTAAWRHAASERRIWASFNCWMS